MADKTGPFVTITVEQYNRMRQVIKDATDVHASVVMAVATNEAALVLGIIRKRSFQVAVQCLQNSLNKLMDITNG